MILHELRRAGFDPDWQRVETEADYIAHLDPPPKVILADYTLPQFDAIRALLLLQERNLDIPVIVVTGSIGEEAAVNCIRHGAADYLLKDRLARLGSAVEGVLVAKKLRDEKRQAEAQVKQRAEQLLAINIELEQYINEVKKLQTEQEATLKALPDLLVELDCEGRVHNYHARPDFKFIIPPEEFLGKRTADFLLQEPADIIMEALSKAGQTGVHRGKVFALKTPAGTEWREPIVSEKDTTGEGNERFLVLLHNVTEQVRRQRELEAIAKAGNLVRQAATQSEMLSTFLVTLEENFYAEAIAFTMTDKVSGEQVIEQASGGWKSAIGDRLGPSEGITSRVIATKKPYLDNDFTPVKEPQHTHLNLMALFNALLCAPMVAKEEVIGTIWLGRKEPFNENEVNLILAISEMAAGGLYKLMLMDETKKYLNRLESLRKIDIAISSSLELNKVLAAILGQVISRLEVDAADILLFDSDSQKLICTASEGFRTKDIKNTSLRLGQGFAGQAALHKKTISVPELSLDDPNFARRVLLKDEGFASLYATPLIFQDTVIGVLEVFSRETSILAHEKVNFFETLAGQITIALNNARLYSEVMEAKIEIENSYNATLTGWVRALDLRDHETEHHTQRVTDLALDLAIFLGVSEKKDLENIVKGAQLHDIGKIGVPDSILGKPDPLNEKEWEIIKQHPAFAKHMLADISYLRDALDIPYSHHEKWDGTGYPQGLKGEQIPYFARIFSVVDVWDALTSDRPYRKAWSKKKAFKYIKEQSGKHFEPAVVKAFVKFMKID